MDTFPAPKITATLLRQALATRSGVVVQDATTGAVWALPQGMSKLQSMDGNLIVVLTNVEAEDYVTGAAGSYAAAARSASIVLAWEIETIEARLSRVSL